MVDALKKLRLGACCGFVLVLILASSKLSGQEINVLYIGNTDVPVYFGARQGLLEANAQGEFMGVVYRLTAITEVGSASVIPVAIIAAVDAARLEQVIEVYPHVPILNTILKDTNLRENCDDALFHIPPSTAMLEDAERQWRQHAPKSKARAYTWHRTFRKYAAAQLNIRFMKQVGFAMDNDAWAGWAAMKLLADTIVRRPDLQGFGLVEELKTNLAFDGQKGIDMSFRETGQLRQPLLLIEQDKIVGEAPVRGVVNGADLDSLGLVFCAK